MYVMFTLEIKGAGGVIGPFLCRRGRRKKDDYAAFSFGRKALGCSTSSRLNWSGKESRPCSRTAASADERSVPDATTLLKCRHLLETHDLCKGLFGVIADLG